MGGYNRGVVVRRLIMTALVAMVAMPAALAFSSGGGPGYGGDCRAGDHDARGNCVRTEYVVVTSTVTRYFATYTTVTTTTTRTRVVTVPGATTTVAGKTRTVTATVPGTTTTVTIPGSTSTTTAIVPGTTTTHIITETATATTTTTTTITETVTVGVD